MYETIKNPQYARSQYHTHDRFFYSNFMDMYIRFRYQHIEAFVQCQALQLKKNAVM